jgi:inner membrane protein
LDPVTHALTSLALDRAGLRRVSRLSLPILVTSGVAADVDLLSYFGGAAFYLRMHDTLFHSLLGSAMIAVAVALAFWIRGRKNGKSPLRFAPVFLLCVIGAAAHVLLDLTTTSGVQLFWPISGRWIAWDLLTNLDLWILAILLVGLLLPSLFRLVTEEIGMRRNRNRPSKAALAALVMAGLYIGLRGYMHHAAVQTLLSEDYHGRVPLVAGAFPNPTSPFSWRGVVNTSNTIETVRVNTGPGASFYAESSISHFKPVEAAPLNAAQHAPDARRFLAYAQFPMAEVEQLTDGWRVTLRDMRFSADSDAAGNLTALIQLDSHLDVTSEEIQFTSGTSSTEE